MDSTVLYKTILCLFRNSNNNIANKNILSFNVCSSFITTDVVAILVIINSVSV